MMLYKLILIISIICVISVRADGLSKVNVTVRQGILEGDVWKNTNGFVYHAFLSIPFAKPPLGDLRFKDPEPAASWDGIRDATTRAPVCSQITLFNIYTGSEDCLYLNVYVPANIRNGTKLPVMFWIHGGAYSFGSGNADEYSPSHFIEKDVIVVTINYRLSVLGFLSLQTSDVPGNAGSKDQVLALKWVNDNIEYFGGDSSSITIFGESAGGASVHYILLSSVAKGLYARAIIQSGVSINEWAIENDPIQLAVNLGNAIGLSSNDTGELVTGFRNLPVEELVRKANEIQFMGTRVIGFLPVIETNISRNPFITEDPYKILESGNFNKVPTISGFVSEEGLLFLNDIDVNNISNVEDAVPDFKMYIPGRLKNNVTAEESDSIARRIRTYYFENTDNIVDAYIKLNSDFYFNKDIDKSTKIFSKYISNTYYYVFSYHGALNLAQYYFGNYNYTGAAHADELAYMFDSEAITNLGIEPTVKDLAVRKRIVEMWSNFAKFGNPTPELTDNIDVIWKPIRGDEINCVDIDEQTKAITSPLKERMEFWRKLEADYLY